MRRDFVQLGLGHVITYGHYGRPFLAFPAEAGQGWDFENNGMVDAIADLIDGGRMKLYCVNSADADTWSNRAIPTEERARGHERYEEWLLGDVVPFIAGDCDGPTEIATMGCSLGAFHAVNVALRHADIFRLAIGLSGNYDPTTWRPWGEYGMATYFNNPMAYLANADGADLDWLRSRVSILVVVGQGAWEVNPTGALPSTRAFADLLAAKGIPHELDLWGFDVPHDWPSWQAQLRHHLPRFC